MMPVHTPSPAHIAEATHGRWRQALAAAHSPIGQTAFRSVAADAPVPASPAHAPAATQPLQGWLVSVKDLFDVQGQITAAGSLALADAPVATQHAGAVQRLLDAGALIIGRTHMVEFAFSGMGCNPHFPPLWAVDACHAPRGALFRALEAEHVSGGSSSGAALSVAIGAADIGLGSDTGGSIRIPAAFNGLVGFKSTQALVPLDGALPLSPTLDTACAITRDVRSAIRAHEALAARTVTRSPAPLSAWRLAVVRNYFCEGLDATTQTAFTRSLDVLRQAGARITVLDCPPLDRLAEMARLGSFAAAESYAWHQPLLAEKALMYDPRVRQRIEAGAAMSAADYLRLHALRRAWQAQMAQALGGFDAVLSPTVAITAPLHAQVAPGAARDGAFFQANAQVLRNTSAINMLDGCAISIPCHAPQELPVGLMLWHGAGHDDAILNIALLAEAALAHQWSGESHEP